MNLHDLNKAAELAERLKAVREQINQLTAAIEKNNVGYFKVVAKEKINFGGKKVPDLVTTLREEALVDKLNAATIRVLSNHEDDLIQRLKGIGVKVN